MFLFGGSAIMGSGPTRLRFFFAGARVAVDEKGRIKNKKGGLMRTKKNASRTPPHHIHGRE
jgi:hypothetical protein